MASDIPHAALTSAELERAVRGALRIAAPALAASPLPLVPVRIRFAGAAELIVTFRPAGLEASPATRGAADGR